MAKRASGDTLKGAVDLVRLQQIRVSIRTVGTQKLLDLRVWVEEGGEWIPTGRGFALGPDEWKALRAVLGKLSREKSGQADG